MLSYRHGFHAGNAADVLKHMTLVFCLEYGMYKGKPLLCVDTHAGAGRYRLDEGFAAQKGEWQNGAGRLLKTGGPFPAMLRRYLDIIAHNEWGGIGAVPPEYPGSPLIMAGLLRPHDRLVCFEAHPADYGACVETLQNPGRGRCSAEVRNADGFAGLKALLPPPSRRGIVLIDPPYEVKDDYRRLPETLAAALKRFPGGTYIVWYPLLREAPAPAYGGEGRDFPSLLMGLYPGNRCRLELYTADPSMPPENSPRGMYGSGLVIFNPPWTLMAALEESLPVLGAALGTGEKSWTLDFHRRSFP
jgi:23S rRNA (adenine2030-N6)-methyltransferase